MKQLLTHYWPELVITLIVWVLIGWKLGLTAFFITVVLSLLEITLSADNAVVNSRVLVKMSLLWQRIFLTVGIFIAVFVVRFALPIVLVALAAGIEMGAVLQLAINKPEEYGDKLHDIAHIIDSFGGIFLLMVALFFFIDATKKTHWIKGPEQLLARLGGIRVARYGVVAAVIAVILVALPSTDRVAVALSMAVAVGIYGFLHTVTYLMERVEQKNKLKEQVGWAAFISFMYLEVLDASFSLDGVVGAFAITNNIVIIMAGLGIGAIWVRTFTIYMVRHKTLTKYKFIESGAHWAILALATIMLLKLFGVELPEIIIGTVGLVFIVGAIYSSVRANKKSARRLV